MVSMRSCAYHATKVSDNDEYGIFKVRLAACRSKPAFASGLGQKGMAKTRRKEREEGGHAPVRTGG